jgi:hypothetical protein
MRQNAFISGVLVSISFVAAAHASALRTVAFTGQQAPGTDSGVTYDTFDAHYSGFTVFVFRGPVLNDAGQVAFRANLTGSGVDSTNQLGVWSEGSSNLGLVARTGSSAPGGGTFATVKDATNTDLEIFSPNLNEAGQVAFWGGLSNGNVGIWSEGSGSLALVAREGTPAPGTPSGVSFWFAGLIPNNSPFFEIPPLLNNAGQTSFTGALKGSGVNSTNDTGLWSEGTGSLSLAMRSGNQAVGLPSGVNYDCPLAVSLNDAGQSGVTSYLVGSGVDDTNYAGYWSGAPGNLALVQRMGDPAPGAPDGVNFAELFGSHGFNNAGQIAISGPLTGNVDATNDEGLWTNVSGSLDLVARKGSPAAGTPTGVNYGTFTHHGWPVLNDAGRIAFITEVAGTGVDESNNEGIWSGATDDLTLLARRGDPAPDTPSGVNYSDLQYPALNSFGQVAFRGDLTGSGVDPTNDKGIWATDQSGALQLIARSGDMLEVAPGDFRTLSDLNFATASGNSDGRSSGFNNLGQLVFWASFTDGSQGVFVSNKVASVPGDFNNDGTVDAADYVVWRKGLDTTYTQNDYEVWRAHFGASLDIGSGAVGYPLGASAEPLSAAVPEPASLALLLLAAIGVLTTTRVFPWWLKIVAEFATRLCYRQCCQRADAP